MSRIRKNPPGVDPRLLIKDAAKLMPDPTRRLFLRGGDTVLEERAFHALAALNTPV